MTTTQVKKIAPTTVHIAGYIRLTRDESLQNNLSAPAQRKGIHEYATRANLHPLKVYEETKAIGGDTPFESRPAGSELIEAIKAGLCQHVIVRDLDRLTRDIALSLELVALCRQHRVTIHTFTGPLSLKSASDLFAFHVRSAASEFEKNQTGDRVRKAKQEAVEQGRWQGPPAYGYHSQAWRRRELINQGISVEQAEIQASTEYPQKAKLYVYPEEAKVLKVIYSLALSGMGSRRIVNELNKRGFRTRTGVYWSIERLTRTVNNPAAAGYLTYDTERQHDGKVTPKRHQKLFKGNHEPIITLEEWKKVQAMRLANTDKMRNRGDARIASRKYPLSGILHCACGEPMRGKSHRAKDKYGSYVCRKVVYHGRKAVNGCNLPSCTIPADLVHEVFWPKLREILTGPNLVDQVYATTQRILRDEKSHKVEVRDLGQRLAKLEAQIAKWYAHHDAAQSEAAQEAAWRRIVELTEEKKQIEKARADQTKATGQQATRITKEQISQYLASMTTLLDKHGGEEAKHYLHSLATHHGLSARMTGPETMTISLAIKSPGTVTPHVVQVDTAVHVPKDKIGDWVSAEQGKHSCEGCGKPIEILRRHFWMGIPKHHPACWTRVLAKRRNHREDGLLTGAELARRLGIGQTTICRWEASGKLPPPLRRERGTKLWHPNQLTSLSLQ